MIISSLENPCKDTKKKEETNKKANRFVISTFSFTLPIEIKAKERNMKCRNCNNEVSEKDKNCPYCNTPLNNNDTDNGPTLGRGMVLLLFLEQFSLLPSDSIITVNIRTIQSIHRLLLNQIQT